MEASVARFAALGTRVELHLFGRVAPDALVAARAAIEAVEAALTVRRESPAMALNRALASGGEMEVANPLLWEALLAVDAMWRATGGLFDPGAAGGVPARGWRDAAADLPAGDPPGVNQRGAPADAGAQSHERHVGDTGLLRPQEHGSTGMNQTPKPVPRRRAGPSWEGRGGSLERSFTRPPASPTMTREGDETISHQRSSRDRVASNAASSPALSRLDPGLRRGDGNRAAPPLPLPRWSALRIDRATHRVAAAHPLALDFGGFGKGFALDRAAAVLRSAGVTSAFLSAGESSIAVIGEHPLGGGWPLAIPHPEIDGVWLTALDLTDASLSVSSTVGAGAAKPGRAAMIRPTDGAIVTHRATAVAVAATGAEAEALSTALLVADAAALDRLRAAAPDRRFLFSHDAPARADRAMELTA